MSLKTFLQIPALSWAISYSVFQPFKFASTLQKLLATFFQILDIWRSSLDIMDDFKLISRMAIFRFGEINKSWFWVWSNKNFLIFFLVRYYILNYEKFIKFFFFQNWQKNISIIFFQNFFFQFWKKKKFIYFL